MTFSEWMDAVDKAVNDQAGVSVHDLADATFMDWYEDEMTPKEAAELVLEDNGWTG